MAEAIASVQATSQAILLVAIVIGVLISILSILFTSKTVVRPIQRLADRLEDISAGDGDLTMSLDEAGNDELSDVAKRFNLFLAKLRGLMTELKGSVDDIDNRAGGFASITEDLQSNVSRQQQETQTVAAAVNEMAASVREVATNASAASSAADEADRFAKQGQQVVTRSVGAVEGLAGEVARSAEVLGELDEHSQQIESVLDVIKTIAEQTNLLALNAAIEAARAGEQGRGFAVVADEVRTLASRTQESTEEIQSMIEALQSASKQAVDAMKGGDEKAREAVTEVAKANEVLESIAGSIADIVDRNVQIASAAEEQSSVAEEINRNVSSINQVSNETGGHAEHTARGSAELSAMAKNIASLVGQFKTAG
jgi:methyl-accepting chemotaxis protein